MSIGKFANYLPYVQPRKKQKQKVNKKTTDDPFKKKGSVLIEHLLWGGQMCWLILDSYHWEVLRREINFTLR